MTTITNTATTPALPGSPASSPSSASSTSGIPQSAQAGLDGDFTMFLKMLTTQLQNQDPLQPMDSTQFTQQLVSYSQVEQAIKGNDKLDQLSTLLGGQSLSQAVSMIGRDVSVNSPTTALGSNGANWDYTLGTTAASATLTVTDAQGNKVAVLNGPTASGVNHVQWNGTDSNGNALPPGAYTLQVNALDSAGNTITSSVTSRGIVQTVDYQDGAPILDFGGVTAQMASVLSVSPAA